MADCASAVVTDDDDDTFREKSPHVWRRLKFSGAWRPDAGERHGACLWASRAIQKKAMGAGYVTRHRGPFVARKRLLTSRVEGETNLGAHTSCFTIAN